tara:strand:+ start:150 stop:404 length:255 start_codon:yes stop_codon:yes gene_type:complete
MCLFNKAPKPPTPAPLAPPPPPPAPPAPPLPTPDPLETDVNPQVRRARSQKDKNPMSKGTGALRIPLKNTVNTGTNTPSGGLNV